MSPPADPLWIASLSLHHFAGVRPSTGFTLDGLSPGLNLIYGPNGCGKSTTAAALRALLWSRDRENSYALLEAEVRRGPHAWILERRGETRHIRSLDASAAPPPLPPPETRARYLWALRDLLSGSDDDLAARVAREMAGGVDFNALESRLGAANPPSAPRKLQDEYRRVQRRLREALHTQQDLHTRARELENLRRRVDALEREAALAAPLDLALERVDLRRQRADAQREADTFPPDMDRLRAGDAPRARKAADTLRETRRKRDDLQRRRTDLQHHEPDWRVLGDADLQHALRNIEHTRRRLDEATRRLDQAAGALTEQEAAERHLRSRLGLSGDIADSLATHYGHPELRAWIQGVLREQTLQSEIDHLRRCLPEAPADGPDLDDLRNARRELEHALCHADPGLPRPTPGGLAAWLALAVALLLARHALPPAAFTLLLLPPLLGLLLHRTRRERQVSETRKRLPPDFRPSEPWTPQTVRDAAAALDAHIRDAHTRDLAREDRRRLEHAENEQRKLRNDLDPLETRIRDANVSTPVDREWLGHFFFDVQQWRERREQLALAENRLREAESEHADRQTDFRRALAPLDAHADADSLIERLQNELDRRRDARDLLVQAEALSARAEDAENELQEICDRNRLDPDALDTLHTREQKLPAWEDLQQRLRTLDARLRDLDPKLADHPDWNALDRDALETLRERAAEARETAKNEMGVLTKLEVSIDHAKQGREVHQRREELERCRRELEADRHAALRQRLVRQTLAWLREAVRHHQRPEVLERARHHLARFTGGDLALDLRFTEEGETFRAGRPGHPPRPLDTLSGGERAQLLMAVRLAFLSQQEPAPLPLFVDEALGTSDDRRADAILHTLLDIARQGRQIFYFTARADEIAKWQRALADSDLEPAIIDLAAHRAGQPPAPYTPPPPADIAPPDPARRPGESDADWAARLGVPRWNPHQPAETAHLFLLFRHEEDDLVRCLRHAVTTWGALKALIEADAATPLVSPGTQRRVQARAAALEALAAAWRVGRPTPVPPELILDSGIVSDTFRDDILSLLRREHHQAPAFLAALENKAVPRWRQDNTDALRALLREHGHLPDTDPLDPDAQRAHAYAALQSSPRTDPLPPEDLRHLQALLPADSKHILPLPKRAPHASSSP